MDVAQGVTINDIFNCRYYLCINSITQVGLQPYSDNTNVAEVYKINYSYQKLGNISYDGITSDNVDIYDFSSVLDSSGETGNINYAYDDTVNPVSLSVNGSVCTTNTYITVSKPTSNIKLIENYDDTNFTEGHHIFTIQTK